MRSTPKQERLSSSRSRLGLGVGALTLALLAADALPVPTPNHCYPSVHYGMDGTELGALLRNESSAWQTVKESLIKLGGSSPHEVTADVAYYDKTWATAQSQAERLTEIATQRLGYAEGSHPEAYRGMDGMAVIHIYPKC